MPVVCPNIGSRLWARQVASAPNPGGNPGPLPGRACRRGGPQQDLPATTLGGRADYAFPFHALDQARRPVVADRQPSLQVTGGGFAVAHDNADGAVIKLFAA